MRARSVGLLVCWLVAGVVTWAAAFWDVKGPEAWTDKEVQRLLSDSPWTARTEVVNLDSSLARRTGGLQGGRIGGYGGAGRPGAGGGVGGDGAGNIGGGTFLGPPDRTRLYVRWVSALPMRQALARVANTTPEVESAPDEPSYRIAVVGMPLALILKTDIELAEATTLQRKGGAAQHPVAVRIDPEDDTLSIEFTFARDEPLTVRDREVEFRTQVGESKIKVTFRLDRMLLKARLAL